MHRRAFELSPYGNPREPRNYYVNVHTTDYPNGAIRGQLSGNGNGQGCGDDDGDDRSVRAAPRRDGGGGCGDDDDQGEDD